MFNCSVWQVFNSDGKYLFSFGGNGEAPGQFNAPTGVTTDRYDKILVADWGNSRIQVRDGWSSHHIPSYVSVGWGKH